MILKKLALAAILLGATAVAVAQSSNTSDEVQTGVVSYSAQYVIEIVALPPRAPSAPVLAAAPNTVNNNVTALASHGSKR